MCDEDERHETQPDGWRCAECGGWIPDMYEGGDELDVCEGCRAHVALRRRGRGRCDLDREARRHHGGTADVEGMRRLEEMADAYVDWGLYLYALACLGWRDFDPAPDCDVEREMWQAVASTIADSYERADPVAVGERAVNEVMAAFDPYLP